MNIGMTAYDFAYRFDIESIEHMPAGVDLVTGTCYDGSHSFMIDKGYKVGDRIYVMGYLVMGDFNVVTHGIVKH